MKIVRALWVVIVLVASGGVAVAADWSRYATPGLQIELPTGDLAIVHRTAERLEMADAAQGVRLDVFAGDNLKHLSVVDFRDVVEHADPHRNISYRAAGRSWFVISGTMPGSSGADDLIYYAKFIFNAGATRFAAFEISYPRALKAQYDPVVTRIEKSLRQQD